jgi:hypothetical protein
LSAPAVGDTVWLYNYNRGRSARTRWFACRIVGETSKSWILNVSRGAKVDKATGLLRGEIVALRRQVEFSSVAVDADIWRDENLQRVIQAVDAAGVETLKAIDDLLTKRDRAGSPT